MQHLLILGPAVEHAAVVEELLSVIGGHDHHGLREHAALAQLGEEVLEPLIELADLGIVEIDQMRAIVGVEVDLPAQEGAQLARRAVHRPVIRLAEQRSEARLGAVIAVDVEVVKEQEEGTPLAGPRATRGPPCAHAIGRAERGGRATALGPGRDGDVALEAAAQAEARPQEDPAHESRRGEIPARAAPPRASADRSAARALRSSRRAGSDRDR